MSTKNAKPLRIGILTHNYPSYKNESKDAGKFVYSFAQQLSEKTEVYVFCPSYGKKTNMDSEKVQVFWFDWGSDGEKFGNWSYFSPLTYLKVIKLFVNGNKAVIDFVNNNRIDYLLSFWNFPSGVFALYAHEKLDIPYATWALGSDIYTYSKFPVIKQIVSKVINNADKVFGNSNDICRQIEKISGRKAKVLPTSNLVSINSIKNPKLNTKIFNFIYLARLEKVKGPDLLIEATKLLMKKRKDFEVNMIGAGSMDEFMRKEISDYKLNNIIKLHGYIEDQSLVNGYLKKSDCLVIPSRSESFPLVITEALQTGTPMIGADVGDVGQFITRNKLGLVFKKGSAEELADCMEEMITNGKELRKMNNDKMLKLSKDFVLKNIVNKFYNSINV